MKYLKKYKFWIILGIVFLLFVKPIMAIISSLSRITSNAVSATDNAILSASSGIPEPIIDKWRQFAKDLRDQVEAASSWLGPDEMKCVNILNNCNNTTDIQNLSKVYYADFQRDFKTDIKQIFGIEDFFEKSKLYSHVKTYLGF